MLEIKDLEVWTKEYFEKPENQDPFYESKSTQLANGCYYRVIVAYKTGIKTGEKKVLVVNTDEYEYKKYVEVYGEHVPSITPHVFRHTFATRMMQRGLDPKSICYIMGDNSIEIIMNTYTHADFPFINQAFKQAMNIDTPNSSTISSTNS